MKQKSHIAETALKTIPSDSMCSPSPTPLTILFISQESNIWHICFLKGKFYYLESPLFLGEVLMVVWPAFKGVRFMYNFFKILLLYVFSLDSFNLFASSEFKLIHELCLYVLSASQRAELIRATLATLHAFLSWIPLGYIFESPLVCILPFYSVDFLMKE